MRIGFPDRYGNPEWLSELEKVLADEDIELVAGAARCLLAHQKTEPVLKHVRRLAAAFGGSTETDMALANVFTILGPRAKEAIPDLVEHIKRGRTSNTHWVNSSLARIGSAAIPELTAAVTEGNEAQQQRIVSVLQNLGSDALPTIVELHGSVHPNVRNNILYVLSGKLDQSPAALKLLLAQAESVDSATANIALNSLSNAPSLPREAVSPLRRWLTEARQAPAASPLRSRLTLLMQAISRIGPDAHDAIPDLSALMTEGEQAIPCLAAAAILSIDPSHTDAGNVLIQSLDTPATQNIAVHALFKLGLRAQRLVPQLEKYVESATLPSRGRLVYLLAVCGSHSESVVSATEELLDSPNNDDRQHAALTLRWLDPRAQHLLPNLLGRLASPQDYARYHIVLALPFVAPDSKEVVTVLADLARNDPSLRMPALMSLAELKDKAQPAAEAVAPLLNSEPTYHLQAAATLVLIDPKSHHLAGPTLLELFERPDNPTNQALFQSTSLIVDAIALLAKDSEEARSRIRKGLTHDSVKVRICAASVLWKVEGQAAAVMPVLLEALDAGDASIYSINDVAQTLGEIGPSAKAAVPTLLRKARSVSIDQQSHVAKALKAIDPAAAQTAGYR
ncbi:MAG: hypothetical protein IAG10_15035 [Planctomycetaceae bacterium]|nr:hypothetical protein [Planctomycetaceae bacterium]